MMPLSCKLRVLVSRAPEPIYNENGCPDLGTRLSTTHATVEVHLEVSERGHLRNSIPHLNTDAG